LRRASLITVIVAVAALAFVAATGGAVGPSRVHASMTARQVVPPLSARGTGAFRGTIQKVKRRWVLRWSLSYRRLSSPAISGQLRLGAKGQWGTGLVGLCRPCRVAAGGVKPITASVRKAILSGRAYALVETRKYRRGEIRGQVVRGG
jgi:hypothetical protein